MLPGDFNKTKDMMSAPTATWMPAAFQAAIAEDQSWIAPFALGYWTNTPKKEASAANVLGSPITSSMPKFKARPVMTSMLCGRAAASIKNLLRPAWISARLREL